MQYPVDCFFIAQFFVFSEASYYFYLIAYFSIYLCIIELQNSPWLSASPLVVFKHISFMFSELSLRKPSNMTLSVHLFFMPSTQLLSVISLPSSCRQVSFFPT